LNIDILKQKYPKIFNALKEDIDALRYLLVIDENYDDDDSDEFDAIDPEDYNYLVYITDLLQVVMGEEVMIAFIKAFKAHEKIEEFYLSEEDLYGIQTNLDDDGIAHLILDIIEEKMA